MADTTITGVSHVLREHEQLLRAATALSVAVFEDINGHHEPRVIIKTMRDSQNQIAEAIADLSRRHAAARRGA